MIYYSLIGKYFVYQVSSTNQAPGDPFQFITGLSGTGTSTTASSPSNPGSQAGASLAATRLSPVVKRHRLDGVRRLSAHPHLPLYLSGGQDGAVLLWEWSHNQQVREPFQILIEIWSYQIFNTAVSERC